MTTLLLTLQPWRKNNPFCPNVCWFHQFSQEILPGSCYSRRSLLEPCVFSCQCSLVSFFPSSVVSEGLGDESFPTVVILTVTDSTVWADITTLSPSLPLTEGE